MNDVATIKEKTHYRKAFNSPYLSSADIVGPTVLTISHVELQQDASKKTKDMFNTAYFAEKEIRLGEKLKPMILNATNCKTLAAMAGSKFIDDWAGLRITVYVDPNVRFGRDTVEGLRISPNAPQTLRPLITKNTPQMWENAKNAYLRDGNFDAVLERADISEEDQRLIIQESENVSVS